MPHHDYTEADLRPRRPDHADSWWTRLRWLFGLGASSTQEDETLLGAVRRAIEHGDPMPQGMVDRSRELVSGARWLDERSSGHLDLPSGQHYPLLGETGQRADPKGQDRGRADGKGRADPDTPAESADIDTRPERISTHTKEGLSGVAQVMAYPDPPVRPASDTRPDGPTWHYLAHLEDERTMCGALLADPDRTEFFGLTGDWDQVACQRCLEVGRGLGEIDRPDVEALGQLVDDEYSPDAEHQLLSAKPAAVAQAERDAKLHGDAFLLITYDPCDHTRYSCEEIGCQGPYVYRTLDPTQVTIAGQPVRPTESLDERSETWGCHGNTLYWCPTADGIECPDHGGFDTCCAHPELHKDMRWVEQFLQDHAGSNERIGRIDPDNISWVRHSSAWGPEWHLAIDDERTICGLVLNPEAYYEVRDSRPDAPVCEKCEPKE